VTLTQKDSGFTQKDSGFLEAYTPDPIRAGLLTRIDTYYDTAPRATARAEEHGSMVLFVAEQGWPFYARPRMARNTEPTPDEIHLMLARQIELELPRALEWIHETAPSLATAARSAGMTVHECPLLVLGSALEPGVVADGEVRLMEADDSELGNVNAAIDVAFGRPGTAVGETGVAHREASLDRADSAQRLGFTVDALRSGRTVCAGAFVDGAGAVGGGSHNPRGAVSEIVGVGMLPAFRRRGLAGVVAHLLARDALDHGVTTVFCGAESNEVARVYERVGFRRVGTSCVAEVD
jgi:RimJ/RimL family protein N-acetyltransferase